MAKTYLEFRDGGSNKFWEIAVAGHAHTVRFGKLGTDGRLATKSFKSAALAQKDADALIKSKLNKGYVPGHAARGGSAAKPARSAALSAAVKPKAGTGKVAPKGAAGAKPQGKSARSMATIVDELVASQAAAFPKAGKATLRKPATKAQIAALEKAWRRPLPSSYRAFLEITNGIAGAAFTHRLVGTEDQKWAAKQIADLTEFWDEEDAPTPKFPVAIPSADDGINNFAAFDASKKGDELPVVDWDNGRELQRFKSFAAFLESEIKLLQGLARGNEKPPANDVTAAKTTLAAGTAIAKSGPARQAAFAAVLQLTDVAAIANAVTHLVAAKPSADELEDYLAALEDQADFASRPWNAKADLLFRPDLAGSPAFQKLRIKFAINVLEHIAKADAKRAAAWCDVLRPAASKDKDLAFHLAWIYGMSKRDDDALALIHGLVKAGCSDADRANMFKSEYFPSLANNPAFQACQRPAAGKK